MKSIIKETPVSEKRRNFVIDELNRSFIKSALGRNLVQTKKLTQEEINSGSILVDNFLTFGVNTLIDKVWFIDAVIQGAHYSYEGIGGNIGEDIGRGETKHILDSILNECKLPQNIKKFIGKLTQELIEEAINHLKTKDKKVDSIITNVYESHDFWAMKNFKGAQRPSYMEGELLGIPVYPLNIVPKGLTLLLDKNIGVFYIKKPLEINMIENFDKEKVIKDIPSLTIEELDEKVVLKALETIQFKIIDRDAVRILENTSTLI